MCSGSSARACSKVKCHKSSDSWDSPKIRSMLMLSKPPSRRRLNARRARSAVCRRFIQRRIPSSNDWTPMLIRFTPRLRKPRTYSGPFSTMSSGLTSTVNSSKSAGRPRERRASRHVSTTRPSAESGSTEGVPPPIYNVFTDAVAAISAAREEISRQTSST